MKTSRQELLIKILKGSLEHVEELNKNNSESQAYMKGYLQGTVSMVIQELEEDLKIKESEEQELQDEYGIGAYPEED